MCFQFFNQKVITAQNQRLTTALHCMHDFSCSSGDYEDVGWCSLKPVAKSFAMGMRKFLKKKHDETVILVHVLFERKIEVSMQRFRMVFRSLTIIMVIIDGVFAIQSP